MRRPGSVRFVGVLLGMQAVGVAASGVIVLVISTDIVALDRIGVGRGAATVLGLLLLGLGLLAFAVIDALWRGSPAARAVVTALTMLAIASNLVTLTKDVVAPSMPVLGLALNGLVLVCLYGSPAVTTFFDRDRMV